MTTSSELELFRVAVCRHYEFGSQLAVDLQGHFDFAQTGERFVVTWPRIVCQRLIVSEGLPELLSHMRCVRRKHKDQRFHPLFRSYGFFGKEIDKLHHARDRSIEAERLDVSGHRHDGAVYHSVLFGRGCNLTYGVNQLVLFRMRIDHQSPYTIQEVTYTVDAGRTPRLGRLQRAHEHFIQTQRIGTIFGNNCVWIHDIAASFGHLVRAAINSNGWVCYQNEIVSKFGNVAVDHRYLIEQFFGLGMNESRLPFFGLNSADPFPLGRLKARILHFSENHSLIDQFMKWLGMRNEAAVVEYFVPESRIQQVQDRMLSPADIQVDRHPGFFLDGIHDRGCILWIDEAQVVPTRACPLRHGVGFSAVAFPIDGDVEPAIVRFGKRWFGPAVWLVVLQLRQIDRQIMNTHGTQDACRFPGRVQCVQDRKGLAPKSLPTKEPVSQLVVDRLPCDPVCCQFRNNLVYCFLRAKTI